MVKFCKGILGVAVYVLGTHNSFVFGKIQCISSDTTVKALLSPQGA